MQVVKRDGRKEQVKFEKISKRIARVCKDLKNVDPFAVAQKVIQGLYDGVSTKELDVLAVETAYSMSIKHPDYDTLATRLAISNLHKETPGTFSEVIKKLYNTIDFTGNPVSVISKDIYNFVKKHGHVLDATIDYNRDYIFDYFGFKTLERSYLFKVYEKSKDGKVNKKIIERPQHMWMRTAVGIHGDDIDAAINTYHMLSTKQATHATPTLFNSGLVKNQLSSCFLIAMKGDSVKSIYETLTECALISQAAGGIGLHIHNIRSKGSPIYGTNGISNGIVPMLKNFNETARYIDQCVTGDTLIETEGGLKEIKDLDIQSDKVQTLSGFSPIITKKEFDLPKGSSIIEIETAHGKINITEGHPILALKNVGDFSETEIKEKLKRGLIKAEWTSAVEISDSDVVLSY